ncbi:hypothetical protein QJS04_geneDACA020151 [Acorus gramineus]|uniref:Uncharacterized protein n=1 Tax=Acorus gramineus TaxID=55184 RepID=A0AAV9BM50_ACOGR|nr:hypothetical protein QJS04_geneDACA020151 [Acorus gramineus]
MDEYPSAIAQVLPRQASDHSPIILHSDIQPPVGRKPFRFERIWFEYPNLPNVLEKGLEKFPVRSPLVNLHRKLIKLQSRIRRWNRDRVGNIQSKLQDAHSELDRLGSCEFYYGVNVIHKSLVTGNPPRPPALEKLSMSGGHRIIITRRRVTVVLHFTGGALRGDALGALEQYVFTSVHLHCGGKLLVHKHWWQQS